MDRPSCWTILQHSLEHCQTLLVWRYKPQHLHHFQAQTPNWLILVRSHFRLWDREKCKFECLSVCLHVNEQKNCISLKIEVMQSCPPHRTCFGQYNVTSAALGWLGDLDCYLTYKMQSGGWAYPYNRRVTVWICCSWRLPQLTDTLSNCINEW